MKKTFFLLSLFFTITYTSIQSQKNVISAIIDSNLSTEIPYIYDSNDMPSSKARAVAITQTTKKWQSDLVKINKKGELTYYKDAHNMTIPNFSHAGYKNGDSLIPEIRIVKEIFPLIGVDNTAHIQAAIDEIGSLPLNSSGIRGALLLKKGLYKVKGPIYVNYEGIVIRGEGFTGDTLQSTVIYDTQRDEEGIYSKRSIIVLGNKTNDNWQLNANNKEDILDDVVEVGSYTFRIKRNENYQVGDPVVIDHPSTDTWLKAVEYGGNTDGNDWTPSSAPIAYHRYITKIEHRDEETHLTIDAPVFYSLRKSLSQCTVTRFTSLSLQNIGIENIRIDMGTKGLGTNDENHAANCVYFKNVENCWARNVVTKHFVRSGFITERATRVSIEDCYAIDPVAIVRGARFYNFNTYHMSQLILIKNCYARGGRHNYVSNGNAKTSGCVITSCKSEASYTSSESHKNWTQGMLFDNFEDFNPIEPVEDSIATLGFYCRINMGKGHGWAAANCVLWNCNVVTDHTTKTAQRNSPVNARSVIYCEKPPTSQNYAIGCFTERISDVREFQKTPGYIENTNKPGLEPFSLYEAQLYDRQNNKTK